MRATSSEFPDCLGGTGVPLQRRGGGLVYSPLLVPHVNIRYVLRYDRLGFIPPIW